MPADYVPLPWLSQPNPVDAYSHGLQIGAQIGSDQARQQLQQQQMLQQQQEQQVRQAHDAAVFQLQSQAQARKFAAQQKFDSLVQSGIDPAKALLQVAPDLGESLTGAAQLYKATQQPQNRTTPYQQWEMTRPESSIGKLMADRDAAQKSGNAEAVKQYEAAIQEALTNKGRSVFMGQDDQGRPIFQMSEGGAKPIGSPTVATQSLAQSKNLQYENAVQLLNWLQNNIKPEHLGVSGKTQEFAVDKGLAQLLPQLADKKRIDVRSTLDMAQGLAREIVDSPAGRFSNVERDAILGALPSTGLMESYPDAINRIKRAKEVLRNRGRVYSESLGIPTPSWALSPDEIKARYQAGKASGISPDSPEWKKRGFMTRDEARDALDKFNVFE